MKRRVSTSKVSLKSLRWRWGEKQVSAMYANCRGLWLAWWSCLNSHTHSTRKRPRNLSREVVTSDSASKYHSTSTVARLVALWRSRCGPRHQPTGSRTSFAMGLLSVSLSVCLCLSLSLCVSLCLSLCLCTCLFVSLSLFLSVSLCLSFYLPVSVCLSVCLYTSPAFKTDRKIYTETLTQFPS